MIPLEVIQEHVLPYLHNGKCLRLVSRNFLRMSCDRLRFSKIVITPFEHIKHIKISENDSLMNNLDKMINLKTFHCMHEIDFMKRISNRKHIKEINVTTELRDFSSLTDVRSMTVYGLSESNDSNRSRSMQPDISFPPNLEYLKLSMSGLDILKISGNFWCLKTVSIEWYTLTNKNIICFENVEKITLSSTRVTSLKMLKKCKVLGLISCDDISDDSFSFDMAARIEKLYLNRTEITDFTKFVNCNEINLYQVEHLPTDMNVKKLVYSRCNHKKIDLRSLKHLEYLNCYGDNKITEEMINMENLTYLDCSFTRICDLSQAMKLKTLVHYGNVKKFPTQEMTVYNKFKNNNMQDDFYIFEFIDDDSDDNQ